MKVIFDPNESTRSDLARRALAHLDRETQLLSELIGSLEKLRARLFEKDLPGLSNALADHEQLQSQVGVMGQQRFALREELADVLGVPVDEVTIRDFSELVDADQREQLLARREQLSRLVVQAHHLSRSNVLIIEQSMGLLQRLLDCLTTDTAAGNRYAATGQLSKPRDKSLFQTEC